MRGCATGEFARRLGNKMSKKKTKSQKEWAEAQTLCGLSDETMRMAKELGLSPRTLIENIPSPSQPWKAPVHEWIHDLYEERRRKTAEKQTENTTEPPPADPDSSEPRILRFHDIAVQRANEAALKQPPHPTDDLRSIPINSGSPNRNAKSNALGDACSWTDDDEWDEPESPVFDELDDDWEFDEEPPCQEDIERENLRMLDRQHRFRIAAEYVANALAEVPFVSKVILFGSVACPLKKEVPRFRQFRKEGIALWHECKDVDLAVWVGDLRNLRALQKARNRALHALAVDRDFHVAHHQVEVFIMDTATNRYLGGLCLYAKCPKHAAGCEVPGCGSSKYLQQISDFRFDASRLAPERSVLLCEVSEGAEALRRHPEAPRDDSPDRGADADEDIPF